jgi:hypothetical protein
MPTALHNEWIKDVFGVNPSDYDEATRKQLAEEGPFGSVPAANGNGHDHDKKKPGDRTISPLEAIETSAADYGKSFESKVLKNSLWLQSDIPGHTKRFNDGRNATGGADAASAQARSAPVEIQPTETQPVAPQPDEPQANETPAETATPTLEAEAAPVFPEESVLPDEPALPGATPGRYQALGAAFGDTVEIAQKGYITRDDVHNLVTDTGKAFVEGKYINDWGNSIFAPKEVDPAAADSGAVSPEETGTPPTQTTAEATPPEPPAVNEAAAQTPAVPPEETGAPPIQAAGEAVSEAESGGIWNGAAKELTRAGPNAMGRALAGGVIYGADKLITTTLADGPKVRDGKMKAGDATADVAVKTGVTAVEMGLAGVASGLAEFSTRGAVTEAVAGIGTKTATGAATTVAEGATPVAEGAATVAEGAATAAEGTAAVVEGAAAVEGTAAVVEGAAVVAGGLTAAGTVVETAEGGAAIGTAIAPGVGTAAGALVGTIAGSAVVVGGMALDKYFGGSDKAAKALGGWFDDNLEQPLKALWDKEQAIADGTGKLISPLTKKFTEVENQLRDTAVSVAKQYSEHKDAAFKYAETLISENQKKLQQFQAAAVKHTKELGHAGGQALHDAAAGENQASHDFSAGFVQGGKAAETDLVQGTQHAVASVQQGAKEAIVGLTSGDFGKAVKGVTHGTMTAVSGFTQGLSQVSNSTFDAAKEIGGGIVRGIGDELTGFKNAGKDLFDGFSQVMGGGEHKHQEGKQHAGPNHNHQHPQQQGGEHPHPGGGHHDHGHQGAHRHENIVEAVEHTYHDLTQEAHKHIQHAHQQLDHFGKQFEEARKHFLGGVKHHVDEANTHLHHLWHQANEIGNNIRKAAGSNVHHLQQAVIDRAEEFKRNIQSTLGSFFRF